LRELRQNQWASTVEVEDQDFSSGNLIAVLLLGYKMFISETAQEKIHLVSLKNLDSGFLEDNGTVKEPVDLLSPSMTI
jgi:hypothetical protein